MLDQASTSLHQPLLQSRQRSLLDPTGEIIRSASQGELHSTAGKSEPGDPIKYMLINRLPSIYKRYVPLGRLCCIYRAFCVWKCLNQGALARSRSCPSFRRCCASTPFSKTLQSRLPGRDLGVCLALADVSGLISPNAVWATMPICRAGALRFRCRRVLPRFPARVPRRIGEACGVFIQLPGPYRKFSTSKGSAETSWNRPSSATCTMVSPIMAQIPEWSLR